ncbi:MAG: hypothetical protein HYY03_06285 [Chloroflexi bacterium]|nr:hypothetical protein [Chloroflexota bacterium]
MPEEITPVQNVAPEEAVDAQRFAILISPLWKPLLWPFGATADRAFADIDEQELHVRFGRLFDHHLPLDQVEGVDSTHWPLWAGIGWRTNFRGTVGLVGAYVNAVEVRFKEPQRVRLLIPVPCRRLVLSLEEPHDFMAALRKRLRAPTGEAPRRLPRRGRRAA